MYSLSTKHSVKTSPCSGRNCIKRFKTRCCVEIMYTDISMCQLPQLFLTADVFNNAYIPVFAA